MHDFSGKKCLLNFGSFKLIGELFACPVADRFYKHLPYIVSLTAWGHELYGDIGLDLGADNPVPEIPPGGIAYTNRGNFCCIFFGQEPAWPVEHIGQITGNDWKVLLAGRVPEREIVIAKHL